MIPTEILVLMLGSLDIDLDAGKRTSARENFGTLLFHGAEVKISIELGAEVTAVPVKLEETLHNTPKTLTSISVAKIAHLSATPLGLQHPSPISM